MVQLASEEIARENDAEILAGVLSSNLMVRTTLTLL